MRVLAVNAGSSSLKLALVEDGRIVLERQHPALEPGALPDAFDALLAEAGEPDAVGHRVVHGGERFRAPVELTDEVLEALLRARELAPLHNPPALAAIDALRRIRPDLPAVACFDTAFHATLPAAAATYALPHSWAERWPLRRFGFHGLSHAWVARRAPELAPHPVARLVSCHLGAGASLAAIVGGRSVDTTMGYTPLDGLVMATRSGSVDPGLLLWVQRQGEISPHEAERALDREAGLLGLSGRSGDMQELIEAADEGDADAQLAIDVYVHRLRAGIAAMAAAMGGVDAVAFTGGVGENAALVRERAAGGLAFLGVELDDERNRGAAGDAVISTADASVVALVVQAREELELAADVEQLLSARA